MIWYSSAPDQVMKELTTDLNSGLSEEEASERLKSFGQNKLDEKPPRTFLQRFSSQMKDVMVVILMIAAGVSLGISIYHAMTGGETDWVEPIVILLIVIINGVLGVVQESRAEAALEALKNLSAPSARVRRGGELKTIKSTELVPGDVIEIEAGDMVPADCRLIRSASFRSDESALTGESVPAEKDAAADVSKLAPLGDRINMAYAG
ncbi:MAG TPA: ATPase, partial [Ruminococcaceae bacterium]|nr:ATPase [Oscillospiraceae bacterium]